METAKLKRFAQCARRYLLEQISAKLTLVLAKGSAARREALQAVIDLEQAIRESSQEYVVDRVAYTWFNRFCALRFMDVNRYTRVGVISPVEGQFQPEVLAEAKTRQISSDISVSQGTQDQIFALLDGTAPSHDPQGEAYRLLVVGACNYWHETMPFLFERINDYTELLMPDDLLSGNSILAHVREAMTPDACRDVEVIGWLYQFYISEKKDAVFAGKSKITEENIPAATQLFTPHWIVRYLVENSLGRLWMLNRPNSKLVEKMDYYIQPDQPETDFLRVGTPEEIKVCDPACGSGHILTYAFDLLYAIYEEEGYDPIEIPGKILTHNLYGIEIDERAGELAAFALIMKARARYRRFFQKAVQPHICVLESIQINEGELKNYMDFVGRDLFTMPLQTVLRQFEEAKNFGSLIRPEVTNVPDMLKILESKGISEQLFLQATHEKVMKVLQQADYLSPKYHAVIANPPYMGSKGMNARLSAWARDNYPDSKSDLFAMFIERNLDLVRKRGMVAMITMQSWMFLSSYEALRAKLLGQYTLLSMAHLGARAFDSIGGEVVSTTAFILQNANRLEHKGEFFRLINENSEAEKEAAIREAIKHPHCGWFYRASAADFKKIPGSPIAYWVPNFSLFNFDSVAKHWISGGRLKTHDGSKYIRLIWEIARNNLRWKRLVKGGEFRKHFGNEDFLADWSQDAIDFYEYHGGLYPNKYHGKEGICWSKISSVLQSFRIKRAETEYDSASPTIFNKEFKCDYFVLSLLNSKVSQFLLKAINPTVNTQIMDVMAIPICLTSTKDRAVVEESEKKLVVLSSSDWDAYETSWDFTCLPLLNPDHRQPSLKATYENLRAHWREMTLEMQRLEEENNRIFIEAYGLQDELTPEVPLSEITLTCNPHYRYSSNKSEEELEALLLADTMRELVSYAVGCMFGRYALDKPGLILANQGETIEDYRKQVPTSRFPADDDNVIPVLDGDWFADDITEQFRKFLRVTFGEEQYPANLQFIEQALGKNGQPRTIRDYFVKDFYNDHVKRYKKRPIYWLFSSPKGSFNALIYMHRYRPDTVSIVLNHLREFRAKLAAHKNQLTLIALSNDANAPNGEKTANAPNGEKTKALREIGQVNKVIAELEEYEREVLFPLATTQLAIDLDDGVKVNYPKFGAALQKIPGLEAKDED